MAVGEQHVAPGCAVVVVPVRRVVLTALAVAVQDDADVGGPDRLWPLRPNAACLWVQACTVVAGFLIPSALKLRL
jgi:hypothetical protein